MHTCKNDECKIVFYNKHSTQKYCSRKCFGVTLSKRGNFKQPQKYTDEELLGFLYDFYASTGKAPTSRVFRKVKNVPNSATYRARFGTWMHALVLAGVDKPLPRHINVGKIYCEKRVPNAALRFLILKRDGFRCQYCGGTPDLGYMLHVDHIVPFSKGGKTIEENLITSCLLCNLGKGNSEV